MTCVLTLIFFIPFFSAIAQCPEINPEEIEINVDQASKQIVIYSAGEMNFRGMDVSLYNMDDRSYYFDSEKKKQVVGVRGLSVNMRNNELEIKNLIPGDYVIIIENPGCEKQLIGWGYSGLPNSAIRVEE